MNSVPLIRRALCAAAPAKMQVPAKRKIPENASFARDNCGAAALRLKRDFSL
jgi:hypothetical protein